ncbi:hypothetical protein [Ralstonia solanacearum]|uniref:Uncharacterized protein n=1 Tax=Ralstonia solanacearum TaxID=305 RepID=A0AAE3NDS8_RALSL|nr:hypothetical protein [Ralstonia solanacearum]MBB6584131.1 hypothetical protein [Ralstonia solanacearum]MDB0520115.1 hypothetical protein [Ralstonia solanacearum]
MPVQTEASPPECLTFKPLGIDTWQEHVIYMHPDSAICRAEGFTAQVRADRLAAQLAQATVAASAREGELIGRWVRVSDDLVALVARLEGAERRRAVETDAVRQAFREEQARMAGRIKGLEQDLAVARPALEVYRRRAVGGLEFPLGGSGRHLGRQAIGPHPAVQDRTVAPAPHDVAGRMRVR